MFSRSTKPLQKAIGPNGTPELIEPVSRAKPVTAPMPAKGGNRMGADTPLKSAAPIPAPGGNRMGADTPLKSAAPIPAPGGNGMGAGAPLKFDPSMVQNTTSAGLSGGNALAQATQNNSMSGFKKGGKVKPKAESTTRYASGGSVSKASGRADGIAQRGKTKGRIV